MASIRLSSGGRGRGRGGRGRGRSRGRGSNENKTKPSNGKNNAPVKTAAAPVNTNDTGNVNNISAVMDGIDQVEITDQQVLIGFGPYVRSGNPDAINIHQAYLQTHDQSAFLRDARSFLLNVNAQDKSRTAKGVNGNNSVDNSHEVEQAAVEKICKQVDEAVMATAELSVTNSKTRTSGGPPPGILPPPGLASPMKSDVPSTVPSLLTPNTSVSTSQNTSAPTSILPTPIKSPKEVEGKAEQPPAATPSKIKIRRTQTRLNEQPGKLFANGIAAGTNNNNNTKSVNMNRVAGLTVYLRSELSARWALPLKYLRDRALRRSEEGCETQNLTIRDALQRLTVGLFRYGVADNGSHCSIVSKEILSNEENRKDFPFDIDTAADAIFGTVPFYSPRTPGNVVFRLYFEDEPHITLATGPLIRVTPGDDYSSVLRFILSNFKSKKTNGLSSINSLTSVLELFTPNTGGLEEAGKASWGCLCETRKLVEGAAMSYINKKTELEVSVKEIEDAESVKQDLLKMAASDVVVVKKEEVENERMSEEKTKLQGERYTNERKWKEIQHAYAALLEVISKNKSCSYLFKKEMLSKLHAEYELWCPLLEGFTPNPLSSSQPSLFLAQTSIKKNQLQLFVDSRCRTQKEQLGFIPAKDSLQALATNSVKFMHVFNDFSNAIKTLYIDEYLVSEDVHNRREAVRSVIEQIVTASGAFPERTRVAVFGSSANGFGSPSSDLDLCLQIPQSATDFTKESGVAAMEKLAEKFMEEGMSDVDTVRLTARIPIIKFNFPYKNNGSEILVECDLSLQNPLACLNTALLNTYSKISQETCILASIIKRWAKTRDINNPAMHTLSSYGYVLMLLYYLTSSEPSEGGFVVDPGRCTGSNPPLLVNIQHVDPSWAQNPVGPYREIHTKPHNQYCVHQHPTEPNYLVNTYFYKSGLGGLVQYHSNKSKNSPCLGVLLASFFRYFAYEFDYKKCVVSLDTAHDQSKTKENKAEEDGWSLYKPGLAIEDPFEHFYDVAHVVKTSNFHHIQKEFALAYSKIASAASGDQGLVSGRDLIDLICEPVVKSDK